MSDRKIGSLQVWWIPQVPMENQFCVDVETAEEGAKIVDTLARYDAFQFENRIKPDYCNVGGIRRWCADCDGVGNPGWEDYEPEEEF